MPNETLKEERARLKRETKTLGKNLDRFDMPSMTASTKSIPSTKKIKKEKPVLLETMFGQVTEEEFDKRMKAYKKGIDEEAYKGYLDKRFSQYDNKKKKMNMGRQASAGRGGNAPGRLGMAKRMPVPQATPTAPILPANPIPRPKPPGMSKGGKTRGYGMARGGKACKMM